METVREAVHGSMEEAMKARDEIDAMLERAVAGDREAFDRVLARYRERLEAIVRTRLGARLLARLEVDDVLQETCLRALRSIDRFRPRGGESFLRWLAGIAEHVILKAAEKDRGAPLLSLAQDRAASGVSPSRAAARGERLERLEAALAGLSSDHAQVIRLARLEGLELREVARRMDRSEEAVKQLLSRALKALRRSFGETDSLRLPPRRLGDGGQHGDA
jgi:RNA polymerase sigma-70 factor (ECF subfamily)